MIRLTFSLLFLLSFTSVTLGRVAPDVDTPAQVELDTPPVVHRNPQQLTCYEGPGETGSNLRGNVDYIRDLSFYGVDDTIGYCCFRGTWILYEGNDYNADDIKGNVYYSYGDNNCHDLPEEMSKQASSLKFAGDRDDWKMDTLTLYEEEYFVGAEQFVEDDFVSFGQDGLVDNMGRSAILTGCSSWTVYSGPDYSGSSACLESISQTNCSPSFFPTEMDLGGLAFRISSVRKGCFSDHRAVGQSAGEGKLRIEKQ